MCPVGSTSKYISDYFCLLHSSIVPYLCRGHHVLFIHLFPPQSASGGSLRHIHQIRYLLLKSRLVLQRRGTRAPAPGQSFSLLLSPQAPDVQPFAPPSGSSASCGPIHMLLCPGGSPSAARGSPQTLSDHSPQSKSNPHYIPLSCFCLSFLAFIMSYPAFINVISCLLCTPPSTLQAPKTTERVCPISHCVFCADLSSINTG